MKTGVLERIRRNHALEHATIEVLIRAGKASPPLAGLATPGGFLVYGGVPTEALALAAGEALERLQNGERELAISPFCGTNIVVAAVLAGVGLAISLGDKNRLQRLPSAISTTLFALLASRPLGRLVQKHLTTQADVEGLEVTGITRLGKGALTVHMVRTRID